MNPIEGLLSVKSRVASACARAGRTVDSVCLIAVSKKQPAELIEQAYHHGHRDFGENYAQELRDKNKQLRPLCPDLKWHAIGSVQTKNAKYIAQAAHAFHALDSIEVALELSKRRADPLQCFVEVNLAGESQKAGVSPDDLSKFVEAVRAVPQLMVTGLMCLPPLGPSAEHSRPYFKELARLGEQLNLPCLSMGSTHDFEIAIEEGATHVRVGTAIFGERPTMNLT